MKEQFLSKKTISYLELIIVTIILISFLVIGIACASRLQPVWLDEVAFLDPAMNLYLGKGFTSTATTFPKDSFYVDSTILYPVLAFLWMKIFGVSITAVRSLNYFLTVASALMIYVAVIRLNLITFAWSRIALIILLVASAGIAFNIVSGRYDLTSLTLLSAAFLIYSFNNINIRYILLTCVGFFFPLSSLSLVVYSILLMVILLIFNYQRLWKDCLALLIGIIVGIGFLLGLYYWNGVLNNFLGYSSGHSILKGTNKNILGKILEKIGNTFHLLFFAPDYWCSGCRKDISYQIIFVLMSFLFTYQILMKKVTKISLFGISVSIIIPFTMCYIGKYPFYYSWMSFIPLAIATCASIETVIRNNRNYLSRLLISAVVVVFIFSSLHSGFPRGIIAAVENWQDRDYQQVEKFIENNISPEDIVYTDYSTFYAIKPKVDQVYFSRYIQNIQMQQNTNKPEIKNISVFIFNSKSPTKKYDPTFEKLFEITGGNWYDTGYKLNTKFYHLKVYRRKTVT